MQITIDNIHRIRISYPSIVDGQKARRLLKKFLKLGNEYNEVEERSYSVKSDKFQIGGTLIIEIYDYSIADFNEVFKKHPIKVRSLDG